MKKKILIIAVLFFFIIPIVNAEDITISLEQETYYFLTGDNALIPLTVNNTYDKNIGGTLRYTITQYVNQGGVQYANSNSQSTSFKVEEGNKTISLNFGTSNTPVTLDIDLVFSFEEDGHREVLLNDIKIIFVDNQSQMNNQQNPQQSTSQEIKDAQPNNQNQQQNTPQTPQQKLQNNQMSQDSQALKEQMQKQIQQEEMQQQEFEQNLFNNSEFQKNHQQLQDQGYEITEKNINSFDNDSGEFEINYENKDGQKASMKGTMEDGEIQNIQKQTAEDRQQMLENLNESQKYQDFLKELENEGFNQTSMNFNQNQNNTELKINYENEKNETATITAEFNNNELKDVKLEKEEPLNPIMWILPIIIVIISIILYVFLKKYKNKKQEFETDKTVYKKPFNYKLEADKLLRDAEKLFKQKKYKDAYGKAGQALRLYLSYKYGLNIEITNDDIVKYLKQKNKTFSDIKKCFDLCSLVEFAKYEINKNDFNEIIRITVNTITQ